MKDKSYSSMKIAISKPGTGREWCLLLYVTNQLQQNKVQKHLYFSQHSFHSFPPTPFKAFYPVELGRRQESFVSFSRGTPTLVEMFSLTAITKKASSITVRALKLGNCKVQFALAAQLKNIMDSVGFLWFHLVSGDFFECINFIVYKSINVFFCILLKIFYGLH